MFSPPESPAAKHASPPSRTTNGGLKRTTLDTPLILKPRARRQETALAMAVVALTLPALRRQARGGHLDRHGQRFTPGGEAAAALHEWRDPGGGLVRPHGPQR